MLDVVPMPAEAKDVGQPQRESPFEAMVRGHWDAVFRLLRSLCGNVHDTEDLAQETFLRAWKQIHSFTPGTMMRSWLFKIASNAFLEIAECDNKDEILEDTDQARRCKFFPQ